MKNLMKRPNHGKKKQVQDGEQKTESSNRSSKSPYLVYKNAMKDEAKREEEKQKRKQEKKQKQNATLLVKQKSPYTTYEVVMKPKNPCNAFEHYLENNKNIKCLEAKYQKQEWKKLSVDDKVRYENLALNDRLRFQHETKMYKETIKVQKILEFDEEDVGNGKKKSMKKMFSMRKR